MVLHFSDKNLPFEIDLIINIAVSFVPLFGGMVEMRNAWNNFVCVALKCGSMFHWQIILHGKCSKEEHVQILTMVLFWSVLFIQKSVFVNPSLR